jgi:hypothetical protein
MRRRRWSTDPAGTCSREASTVSPAITSRGSEWRCDASIAVRASPSSAPTGEENLDTLHEGYGHLGRGDEPTIAGSPALLSCSPRRRPHGQRGVRVNLNER